MRRIGSATDLAPFGMQLVGRGYSSSKYRYGFNGKEKDDEVKGEGKQYDYGFRIYDPRIGRFLSVDPLAKEYPWYTPYQFAGNKPVQCIDLDGAEESVPYMQNAAFERIQASSPSNSYVRGKSGDKLGTTLPDDRGPFEKFLESIAPIRLIFQPASHVAQAMNFASSIGTVVYDYTEEQKGRVKSVTTASSALSSNTHTVYVSISGYSEVGQQIIGQLKTSHNLKDLSDAELANYISSVKLMFNPGQDYSILFWQQTGVTQEPKLLVSQIGPMAVPIPGATPILVPPLSGNTSSINSKEGAAIVNVNAISQEMATTLAPGLLQMSKDRTQRPDDGYSTAEQLGAKRQALKDYLLGNNGKADTYSKAEKKKIEKNEKILGERNNQKRSSD